MEQEPSLQPTQVIAKLFGVSTRRVEQLKAEGILTGQGKPTRYDLVPTIQAYIKYLSDRAYGREKKATLEELEKEKLEAEVTMKRAKAEAAELALEELKGALHRGEDVEAITTDHVLYVRSMLMAMPGKLAVDLANCRTATEAAARIQQEVYFVLESLADYRYDPEEYQKRVKGRKGWEGEPRGEEEDR